MRIFYNPLFINSKVLWIWQQVRDCTASFQSFQMLYNGCHNHLRLLHFILESLRGIPKTVAENWIGKQTWLFWYQNSWLSSYFLGMKLFLFFKIESWNIQYLFEIEFCETSKNFNSFSSFRQLLFSFFLSVVLLS